MSPRIYANFYFPAPHSHYDMEDQQCSKREGLTLAPIVVFILTTSHRSSFQPTCYFSATFTKMNDSTVPPTSDKDASDKAPQVGYETGSLVAITDAPLNEIELKPRRGVGTVMISHLSEPSVQFG